MRHFGTRIRLPGSGGKDEIHPADRLFNQLEHPLEDTRRRLISVIYHNRQAVVSLVSQDSRQPGDVIDIDNSRLLLVVVSRHQVDHIISGHPIS